MGSSEPTGNHEISNTEVVMNGEVGSPQSRGMTNKVGGKSFGFGPRGLDKGPSKVKYFIFVMAD